MLGPVNYLRSYIFNGVDFTIYPFSRQWAAINPLSPKMSNSAISTLCIVNSWSIDNCSWRKYYGIFHNLESDRVNELWIGTTIVYQDSHDHLKKRVILPHERAFFCKLNRGIQLGLFVSGEVLFKTLFYEELLYKLVEARNIPCHFLDGLESNTFMEQLSDLILLNLCQLLSLSPLLRLTFFKHCHSHLFQSLVWLFGFREVVMRHESK